MNWIKKFSKGLALVLVSLLIAVVASELIVRATQRYADVASIEVGGSNKIWDRMPSLTTSGNNHPDLEIKHTIAFNKFGARTSNETDNQVADFNVGVFGDSFTENRRIANQFTFVSMLNEHSDNGVFHNFGVDSYGLEQSFQHWLDKRDLIDMDVVLYVLCANDLRNTYEAEIFDKVKMTAGIAENHDVVYVVPLHIKFLSKIHLTYLLMEGYLKGKSLLRPERPDYTLEQYKTRFMQKRGEAKNLHDSRFHDLFADSMLSDYLSPVPSKEVLEIALHFQNTLNTWKKMVIEGGGILCSCVASFARNFIV